jgi:hypothetical protein
MKKILALMSLLIVGMYLVGCSTENFSGEAIKAQKITPEITSDAGKLAQCNQQKGDCGFVTSADLKDWVKKSDLSISCDSFRFLKEYLALPEYNTVKTPTNLCSKKGFDTVVGTLKTVSGNPGVLLMSPKADFYFDNAAEEYIVSCCKLSIN